MSTPAIMPASAPTTIDKTRIHLNFVMPTFKTVDWTADGVYSHEDLQRMRDYMEFPRIRHAMQAQLALQSQGELGTEMGHITAHMMFPNEFPSVTSYIMGKLWAALQAWGDFVTTMLSLFVLGRIVYTLLKWAFGLWAIIGAHGLFSKQILWFPFMDLLQLILYRRAFRAQRQPDADEHQDQPEQQQPMLNNDRPNVDKEIGDPNPTPPSAPLLRNFNVYPSLTNHPVRPRSPPPQPPNNDNN